MTLLEVNRKIANSVEKVELEYWKSRRREFYKFGFDFMNETIEEDKKMGILTEGGDWNE